MIVRIVINNKGGTMFQLLTIGSMNHYNMQKNTRLLMES